MELINLSGKRDFSLETTKPTAKLLFRSDVPFEDLTGNEQISIKILRQNNPKPQLLTNGFVNFKQWILANHFGNALIGSTKDFKLEVLLHLTPNGFIALNGNDVLVIEMKGLDVEKRHYFSSIPAFVPATNAFVYEKYQTVSDRTEENINVAGYDTVVIPMDNSFDKFKFVAPDGTTNEYTPSELQGVLSQAFGISVINSDKTVSQTTDGFLQMPLLGIARLIIEKRKGSSVELLFRKNI